MVIIWCLGLFPNHITLSVPIKEEQLQVETLKIYDFQEKDLRKVIKLTWISKYNKIYPFTTIPLWLFSYARDLSTLFLSLIFMAIASEEDNQLAVP